MINNRKLLKVTEKLLEYDGCKPYYKAGKRDRFEFIYCIFEYYYCDELIFRLIGDVGYEIPKNLLMSSPIKKRVDDYIWYYEKRGYKRIG